MDFTKDRYRADRLRVRAVQSDYTITFHIGYLEFKFTLNTRARWEGSRLIEDLSCTLGLLAKGDLYLEAYVEGNRGRYFHPSRCSISVSDRIYKLTESKSELECFKYITSLERVKNDLEKYSKATNWSNPELKNRYYELHNSITERFRTGKLGPIS